MGFLETIGLALRRLIDWWHDAGVVQRWRLVLLGVAGVVALVLIFGEYPYRVTRRIHSNWRVDHYAAYFTWWAMLVNLGVLGLLAWVCPWWAGRRVRVERGARAAVRPPRVFVPAVAVAMALTALFASQRLDHSFWDDEEYSMRRAIWGAFDRDPTTGEVHFVKLDWERTFFEYRKPNNHVLFSIFARLSMTVWDWLPGDPDLPFSEAAMRLPALIFALLTVAAVAWWLLDLGLPRAGIFAAFLLALHPWFLRYASEARGYSLAMLSILLMAICFRRALLGGDWKWWAAAAGAQFALLYTFPALLLGVVLVNVAILGLVWWPGAAAGPASVQTGRWFFCNAVAGMVALRQMLPLVPQMLDYLASDEAAGGRIHRQWVFNTLNFFLTGTSWSKSEENVYPMARVLFEGRMGWYVFIAVVLAVLALVGLVRMAWGCRIRALIVPLVVLSPVFLVLQAVVQGVGLYEWYLVFSLPLWAACTGAGIGILHGRVRVASAAALLAAYAFFSQPVRGWLLENSLQPIRESVEMVRGSLRPDDPAQQELIGVSFNVPPYVYDSHLFRARNRGEFLDLLAKADAENKPLIVNIGHPATAIRKNRDMWVIFTDPVYFGEAVILRGFDPTLDRMVAPYNPGALRGNPIPE